jgi:hypothetical protein
MYNIFLTALAVLGFFFLFRLAQTNDQLEKINGDLAWKIALVRVELAAERRRHETYSWSCARKGRDE